MGKIAITGGSGFIGSHLVDVLIDQGHKVVIIDVAEPKDNGRGAEFIKIDIMDYASLADALKGCDAVYHLAAEANVDVIHRFPVKSTAVNTLGTIHVLEAAKAGGVKRVLFASTEWVYGAADTENVDENTKLYPPLPNHIYTGQKIASEFYIQSYHMHYGVDYTIMRFGIPFGPRARRETVTCKFLLEALNGGTITLNAGGRQFRQFIYVTDLAKGCAACLKDEARNEIINLNGAEKITILRIAETIKRYVDVSFNIQVNDNGRVGDFEGRMVNSEKAFRLLGWRPTRSYDDAIREYITWFKNEEGKYNVK